MSINDLKGTLYDLLGYFAPGLIAVIGLFVTFQRIYNSQNILESFRIVVNDISAFEVFVLIVISYILGHAIASISSLLIEKVLMTKIKKLKKDVASENIMDKEHYALLCAKYSSLFNTKYNDKNIRKVICYVQARQNLIYETALIFLSFYGMARNCAFIFFMFSIIELYLCIFKSIGNIYVLMIYVSLFIIFLYEYIRFRKYFIDTILSGFLISEKNNL